jgi:signal transduction histidine kinase/HAMP domain-containing protein
MKKSAKKNLTLSRGMAIRTKLLGFAIIICVLVVFASSVTAYLYSSRALRNVRVDGFRTLLRSLSVAVHSGISNYKKEIAGEADTQTLRYAAPELRDGFKHLLPDLESNGFTVTGPFLEKIREALRQQYSAQVLPPLASLEGKRPDLTDFDHFSPAGLILQYVYFLSNPAPMGSKYVNTDSSQIANNAQLPPAFRKAFILTRYSRAMDRYHKAFESLVDRYHYSDLLLLDDAGNVVYTYNKYWDFGVNLNQGWITRSNLKAVYTAAWKISILPRGQRGEDDVQLTDFEKYRGAYDSPRMFFGCQVLDRLNQKAGVLVYEVSPVAFNNMVTFDRDWSDVGLGKTGEAYIVGPDKKLRTERRFINSMPAGLRGKTLSIDGSPGPVTSILTDPINNQPVNRIYTGDHSKEAVTFYNELGSETIGVYTPLRVPGLNWGLVIQITGDEAFKPAGSLTRLIMGTGAVILLVAVGITIFIAHRFLRPITQLVGTAEKIAGGDLTARAHVKSTDEIGFLAERFNAMVDQLAERTRHVRNILATVREGLFLLSTDFVIQPEYSRATENIFQRPIGNERFLELLEPNQDDMMKPVLARDTLQTAQGYLELLLNPRVNEKLIRQTNPLTEVEFRVPDPLGKSKFLEFRFDRVMEAGKTAQIMVTVADITTRILLARTIEENEAKSKTQMEMLFGIIHLDPSILSHFLDETDQEVSKILERFEAEQFRGLEGESVSERSQRYERLIQQTARSLHLIKGNAATLRLSYFENLSNQLEDKLAEIKGKENISGEDFLPLTTAVGALLDQVTMTRDLIERLLAMQQYFGKERHGGGHHEFDAVAELANEIAARHGKNVRTILEIDSELNELSQPLRASLRTIATQLIRNAVVHGIEPPQERLTRQKHPVGEIKITLKKVNNDRIDMRVRDDGRGIDIEQLRRRAVELGYSEEAENRTTQLMELIFKPGFTTLNEANTDAGRGVGLDAVHDLVTHLGGRLTVASVPGEYCEFQFEVPIS